MRIEIDQRRKAATFTARAHTPARGHPDEEDTLAAIRLLGRGREIAVRPRPPVRPARSARRSTRLTFNVFAKSSMLSMAILRSPRFSARRSQRARTPHRSWAGGQKHDSPFPQRSFGTIIGPLTTDKSNTAGDSLMKLLTNVLVSLRKEQAHLDRLLARVNRAIDALTDAPAKKKVATKKRKPMSAAARKAVSEKLKQYWAAKKTAGRKK